MDDINKHSTFDANKIAKNYFIINLMVILLATFLLVLMNTVLKDYIDDVEGITKILGTLLIIGLIVTILVSILIKVKAKVSLNNLPSDINEKFKTGIRFKDMQRFIFADDGLITFVDAKVFYIKYIDIQRAYVFKYHQKLLFIPIFTQYYIKIETLERKYSIPVNKKMDNIKYTEQDFLDLTYELHSKNESISLGGILNTSARIN